MRKHYLDNIRWMTVALVLVYHVFYMFNSIGILGAVGINKGIPALDSFMYFVYPWFMVLLFVISGISARYALEKRTNKQFIKDRAVKLLIPSTAGLFLLHWISGYINVKVGGGLDDIPGSMRYPIFAISGVGPLWFIQLLFILSVLIVIIRKIDKNDRLWKLGGKCNIVIVILLVLPIWGASQILNVPVLIMYRFGIYGLAFLLGYFVFSHDKVQDSVEKVRIPILISALLLGVFYVIYYYGKDFTAAECLQSLFTNLFLWAAILAILGCSKTWFNRTSKVTEYMTKSSFGLYIVHYPVLLVICYILCNYCNLPSILNYIIALVGQIIFTVLIYEFIKRIPVARYLILGIK